MAIIPSDMTEEMNDTMVIKPNATQAVLPRIHPSDIMLAAVSGMLAKDTNMSAAARFSTNKFNRVLNSRFLVTIQNKLPFPIKAITQITIRTVNSATCVKSPISLA